VTSVKGCKMPAPAAGLPGITRTQWAGV